MSMTQARAASSGAPPAFRRAESAIQPLYGLVARELLLALALERVRRAVEGGPSQRMQWWMRPGPSGPAVEALAVFR
jgi:hypothetical protein